MLDKLSFAYFVLNFCNVYIRKGKDGIEIFRNYLVFICEYFTQHYKTR